MNISNNASESAPGGGHTQAPQLKLRRRFWGDCWAKAVSAPPLSLAALRPLSLSMTSWSMLTAIVIDQRRPSPARGLSVAENPWAWGSQQALALMHSLSVGGLICHGLVWRAVLPSFFVYMSG
ncbi:uncharacterized protein K452DRAFT_360936 [Aplosporella prunicola CBS 121167]|uniref:Uncharacterized protein n=1 Tax=Aplosporella prunicola CBS 121167 TaxID=1176127 RepID=A0A6A6B395_9PEZI|nr:uncharacterized protein K452DRAFT_360936 [Aplosporella prunicola CBS 121167]KAF2138692.1 hypothetical protein K452DRAFT_360936 [Aplosporella prunicola CBS 121167]